MRAWYLLAVLLAGCFLPYEPPPDRTINLPIGMGLVGDEIYVATLEAHLHEESANQRTLRLYAAPLSAPAAWRLAGEQMLALTLMQELPPSMDAAFLPGTEAVLAGTFTSLAGIGVVHGRLPSKVMNIEGSEYQDSWGSMFMGSAVTVAGGKTFLWSSKGFLGWYDPYSMARVGWPLFEVDDAGAHHLTPALAVSCKESRCTLISPAGSQIVWSAFDATVTTDGPTPVTFASLPQGSATDYSKGFRGQVQCKTLEGDKLVLWDRLYAVDPTLPAKRLATLATAPFDVTLHCSSAEASQQALLRYGDGRLAAYDLESDRLEELPATIPAIFDGYGWQDVNMVLRVVPLPGGGWILAAGEPTRKVVVDQCDYAPAFESCPVAYHFIAPKIWVLDAHGNETFSARLVP